MSDSVRLNGVEETLMILLWARAIATQRGGLIDDPAAVELVERLEYDFKSKLGHARSMMPMLEVRAARFDEAVREFVDRHPDDAVVELGCGLDTRWERCTGDRVDWFDLDLDAVIQVRRRYFQDGERRTMLAASPQDAAWHDLIGPRDRPFLLRCLSGLPSPVCWPKRALRHPSFSTMRSSTRTTTASSGCSMS